jgi:hypothetical protein
MFVRFLVMVADGYVQGYGQEYELASPPPQTRPHPCHNAVSRHESVNHLFHCAVHYNSASSYVDTISYRPGDLVMHFTFPFGFAVPRRITTHDHQARLVTRLPVLDPDVLPDGKVYCGWRVSYHVDANNKRCCSQRVRKEKCLVGKV